MDRPGQLPDQLNYRPSGSRLMQAAILTTACASVAVALIVWNGSSGWHSGWIEIPPEASAVSGGRCSFTARLSGSHRLFRGNDLFRVDSPQLVGTDTGKITARWDTHTAKGKVHLTANGPLAAGERIPARFALRPRWEKLTAWAIVASSALLGLALGLNLTGDGKRLESHGLVRTTQGALVAATGTLVACIVSNPGWVLGDDHFIISSVVQGRALPATVFPDIGRFFPLGLIDLNLLIGFGDQPLAYHAQRASMFVGLVVLLYAASSRLSGRAMGAMVVLVFLTTPELLRVYADSIFPESTVNLMLAGFFVAYGAGAAKGHGGWLVFACFCATWATYCKEPVFGLFMALALVHLVTGWCGMTRNTRRANLYLVFNGLIFVTVYKAFFSAGSNYADVRSIATGQSMFDVLQLILAAHPAFAVAIAVCIVRLAQLVRHRANAVATSDAALLAGVLYGMAFVWLRLADQYYLIPSYICWTVALAGYLGHLYRHSSTTAAAAHDGMGAQATRFATGRRGLVLPMLLWLTLILGGMQLNGTILCAQTAARERAESRSLCQLLGELRQRGYQLYVFLPPEMNGHPASVQHWRRRVLNTFDWNKREREDRPFATKPPLNSPVGDLMPDQLPLSAGKYVVIHDPAFAIESLNRQQPAEQHFVIVGNVPPVMGAALCTRVCDLTEVTAIFEQIR